MSLPDVRVLPSSRPEARTWGTVAAHRDPLGGAHLAPSDLLAEGPVEPPRRPQPGRVTPVGAAWAATVPEDLPDAARWSGWFAVALGEALLGRRPATQLAGWVGPDVLAGLHRRQRLHPAGTTAPRTVLLSGRVQHPGPRAAEVSAVLRAGGRLLVLAFRLDGVDDGWLCTALDAGLTPARRTAGTGSSARPGAQPAPRRSGVVAPLSRVGA